MNDPIQIFIQTVNFTCLSFITYDMNIVQHGSSAVIFRDMRFLST